MALNLNELSVQIVLDQLVCHDEGQDPGKTAEPFLWTYFFKIDGTTVSVNASAAVVGPAVTHPTPGSHDNLGVSHVGTGQTVPIPAALGQWQTRLIPIPIAAELQQIPGVPDHVAGAIGVVLVLMEYDWTTDATIEAGHAALNTTLQQQLNAIIAGLGFGNQQVTPADVNRIAGKVTEAVVGAIRTQGGFVQDLLNLVNADDFLGADAVVFTQTELAANLSPTFSRRFRPDKRGDWEIRGHVTAQRVIPRP